MNESSNDLARAAERLARLSAACRNGVILVDANGTVVWKDQTARRLNGGLHQLTLPLDRSHPDSIECSIAPVDLTVGGQCVTMAVVQEADEKKRGSDLMAAIETVLADSMSSFTRTVMEKVRTVSQTKVADVSTMPMAAGTTQLDALSARERQVLGLICEGKSDVQMASLLGLSENTVRNHIAALYRKIGVNRRTAAVIWARERGITGWHSLDSRHALRRSRGGHGNTLPY